MGRREGRRGNQGHQCVSSFLSDTPHSERTSSARVDPATEEELGTIPEMGLEETKQAIDAASKAFKTWSKTSAKVRSQHRVFLAVFEHVD